MAAPRGAFALAILTNLSNVAALLGLRRGLAVTPTLMVGLKELAIHGPREANV